jgi:hypothetical protein
MVQGGAAGRRLRDLLTLDTSVLLVWRSWQ